MALETQRRGERAGGLHGVGNRLFGGGGTINYTIALGHGVGFGFALISATISGRPDLFAIFGRTIPARE